MRDWEEILLRIQNAYALQIFPGECFFLGWFPVRVLAFGAENGLDCWFLTPWFFLCFFADLSVLELDGLDWGTRLVLGGFTSRRFTEEGGSKFLKRSQLGLDLPVSRLKRPQAYPVVFLRVTSCLAGEWATFLGRGVKQASPRFWDCGDR